MLPATYMVLVMAFMGFHLVLWITQYGLYRLWALALTIALSMVPLVGVTSMVLVIVLVALTWMQLLDWEIMWTNATCSHLDITIYPSGWLLDAVPSVFRENDVYVVCGGFGRRLREWARSQFLTRVPRVRRTGIPRRTNVRRDSVPDQTALVLPSLAEDNILGFRQLPFCAFGQRRVRSMNVHDGRERICVFSVDIDSGLAAPDIIDWYNHPSPSPAVTPALSEHVVYDPPSPPPLPVPAPEWVHTGPAIVPPRYDGPSDPSVAPPQGSSVGDWDRLQAKAAWGSRDPTGRHLRATRL